MRRALVTGAQGFVGRHLVNGLQCRGVEVTRLDCLPAGEPTLIAMGHAPWDPERLARIVEATAPDAIFHLAGAVVGSPAELEQVNVGLAGAIMQALRQTRARPLLVIFGSAAEYGASIIDGIPVCESLICAPRSPYGATKLAQTNAALEFAETTATPVLVVRMFNPIGPGMAPHLALGDFARQVAELAGGGGTVRTGNLQVWRDFIDVDHVIPMLLALASNPKARGIVNICSGEAIELDRLLALLIEVSGKQVTVETCASRVRGGEPLSIVGSTALLARFDTLPPPTDYVGVIARIWKSAEARWIGPR